MKFHNGQVIDTLRQKTRIKALQDYQIRKLLNPRIFYAYRGYKAPGLLAFEILYMKPVKKGIVTVGWNGLKNLFFNWNHAGLMRMTNRVTFQELCYGVSRRQSPEVPLNIDALKYFYDNQFLLTIKVKASYRMTTGFTEFIETVKPFDYVVARISSSQLRAEKAEKRGKKANANYCYHSARLWPEFTRIKTAEKDSRLGRALTAQLNRGLRPFLPQQTNQL